MVNKVQILNEVLLKMNYNPSMTLKENVNLLEQSEFAMDRRTGITAKNAEALGMSQSEYESKMSQNIGKFPFQWDHTTAGYSELALTIAGVLLTATGVGAPVGVALIGAGTAIGIADAVKYYEEGDPYTGTLMLALQVIPGGELFSALKQSGKYLKYGDTVGNFIKNKTPKQLTDLLKRAKTNWTSLSNIEKQAVNLLKESTPTLVKKTASMAIKAYRAKLLGISLQRLVGGLVFIGKTSLKVGGVAVGVDKLWTLMAAPDSWRMKIRDKASFSKYLDMLYKGTLDDAVINGLWAIWQKLWNTDGTENTEGRKTLVKDISDNNITDDDLNNTEYVKKLNEGIGTSFGSALNALGNKFGTKVNTTGEISSPKPITLNDVMSGKTILKNGSKGAAVSEIQKMLKFLGYDLGTSGKNKDGIDGDYGQTTARAVYLFQIDQDLEDFDGITGEETSSKLKELYDAKKNETQESK